MTTPAADALPMLRHALLLLALLPLAAASNELLLTDASGDATVGWTRGSPVLLGTPCGATDLLAARVAPERARTGVTVQLRDLAEECLEHNPPLQGYSVTLNWQTPEGGEGWTRASFYSRHGVFEEGWTWSVQCPALAPLADCEMLEETDVSVDAATSRVTFQSPVAFHALTNVYVDSVMYNCSSGESGSVCISGRLVGPGDRMPDLPPVPQLPQP